MRDKPPNLNPEAGGRVPNRRTQRGTWVDNVFTIFIVKSPRLVVCSSAAEK